MADYRREKAHSTQGAVLKIARSAFGQLKRNAIDFGRAITAFRNTIIGPLRKPGLLLRGRVPSVRRLATPALEASVVSIPAWMFFIYAHRAPGEPLVRTTAIVTTGLCTLLSLRPTARYAAYRAGRVATQQPGLDATIVALAGFASVVSVALNGHRDVEGLDTVFAAGMFATLGAPLYLFTAVTTPPSKAGERQRALAQRRKRAAANNTETAVEAEAEIGRQDIAAGFRRYGDKYESTSRVFLFGGVILLAAAVGSAVALVVQLGADAPIAAIVTRAAITVPAAFVFAVLVREAAARRRYAAWGALIAIQAEHVGAFIADMDPDDRREVERQFALAVFRGGDVALEQGDRILPPVDATSELVPLSLVQNVAAAVASVSGAVQSVQAATTTVEARRRAEKQGATKRS